jgi:hypothetical protein
VNWERFLRGTDYRSIRIFALGLGVSVVGALIGVTGFWLERSSVSVLGWSIGVLGWAVGAFGVLHGWVTMFRRRRP